MKTLSNWTAKRAGAGITIQHSDGKVIAIEKIVCRDGRVVATDANGQDFELAVIIPAFNEKGEAA